MYSLSKRYPVQISKILSELEKREEKHYLLNKQKIYSEIERNETHNEMIKRIINCFSPNLPEKDRAGFIFQMVEPLIEVIHKTRSGKIADILITNPISKECILIEVKTQFYSDKNANRAVNDLIEAQDFLIINRSIIENQIAHSIEYLIPILIIPHIFQDRSKNAIKRKNADIGLWLYLPNEKRYISFVEPNKFNPNLKKILDSGMCSTESMISLESLLNSHEYSLFEWAVIEYLSQKTDTDEKEIKEFTLNEIIDWIQPRILIGAVGEERREIIKSRMQKVIKSMKKYQVIRGDKGKIKIICRGKKLNVIKKNLKDKYIQNYAKMKAKLQALEEIEIEYQSELPHLDTLEKYNSDSNS